MPAQSVMTFCTRLDVGSESNTYYVVVTEQVHARYETGRECI